MPQNKRDNQKQMKHIIVIGGGAAGMMAAIQSARLGCQTTIIEKNEKLGKKLFITGKGRCNLTNACDVSDFFDFVVSNKKFLYSAIYTFSNQDTVQFFEELGLKTKTERGNRVFPLSDKSSDVIRALEHECQRLGVNICLNQKVESILTGTGQENRPVVTGVRLADGTKKNADRVIMATGGVSYPGTGASGDGLKIAQRLGHTITDLRPGLTGIETAEKDIALLQGVSCHLCRLTVTGEREAKKRIFDESGELLFTHFGVSGPVILSASSRLGDRILNGSRTGKPLYLHVDFKPWLDEEKLAGEILKKREEMQNAEIKKIVRAFLPEKIVRVLLSRWGIDPHKKANQMTKEDRRILCRGMKDFCLTMTGLRKIDEAIITRGGVSVNEVDPSTMESRQVSGLYMTGEMLDVDALTGGFNLQIAWSTGYLAGVSAAAGS